LLKKLRTLGDKSRDILFNNSHPPPVYKSGLEQQHHLHNNGRIVTLSEVIGAASS